MSESFKPTESKKEAWRDGALDLDAARIDAAPDLDAARAELVELHDAVIMFVGAERDAGADKQEILRFFTEGIGDTSIRPRTKGKELEALATAVGAVRMHWGENWKDFVKGYCLEAFNALEEEESSRAKVNALEIETKKAA